MLSSNAYSIGAWSYHIELVYKISCSICNEYGSNYDIVSLVSLLHDVTSITNKDYTENHHIIGVEIAEEILNNDISKEKIMLIKKCILNHRGSVLNEKNTRGYLCFEC